jgi:hypothetical protein
MPTKVAFGQSSPGARKHGALHGCHQIDRPRGIGSPTPEEPQKTVWPGSRKIASALALTDLRAARRRYFKWGDFACCQRHADCDQTSI